LNFFEYDSKLTKFANLLFDLTILNILWLVFSIPVITMGAATAAGYSTAGKRMEGNKKIYRNFLSAFKQYFRQSTLLWIPFLLLTAAFYFGYSFLKTVSVPAGDILLVISVLLFTTLLFIILWAFPVMTTFKGTTGEVLFNALIFSFMYTPLSLAAIVLYFAAAYLFLRYTTAKLFCILFGHALIVYCNLTLFKIAFKKYLPE